MKAILALEDGSIFHGKTFTGQGEVIAPLVFNSYMIGYQETITDPGHLGRILCFTYPLIGSYGVNPDDSLSKKVQPAALIMREYVARPRNFRATASLADFLAEQGVMGVEDMDTRAITRRVSQNGPMGAVLSTVDIDPQSLVNKARNLVEQDLVALATSSRIKSWAAQPSEYSLPFAWQGTGRWKAAVLDLGLRKSLLTRLLDFEMELMVLPANTTSQQIMELKPHGLIVSSGPGSPHSIDYVVKTLSELIGKLPMWGIGLGHLALAKAAGAGLRKAIPGYFSGSQAVQETVSKKVGVSDQNLLYALDNSALPPDFRITYRNQLDDSIAGFVHNRFPLMGVSFNPEVPGCPLGDSALFADFTRMLRSA